MVNQLQETIKRGNIVAYPTESFYALGVDATNAKAIQRLFRVKYREKGKPIALVAADMKQVKKFFYVSTIELRLAKKYWPGVLTILLRPKPPTTPASGHPSSGRRGGIAVRALLGLTTPAFGHPSLKKEGRLLSPCRIGVRVPAHAGARRLAKIAGGPLTATSANISGQPPTKSAAKVKRDFPGILIWPGRCGQQRLPSTVIEIVKNKIITHRLGSLNLSRKSARVQGNTIHV